MNRIPDSFKHGGIRTPRWLVLEVDKLERPTGRVFVMLDGKRFSKAIALRFAQQVADLYGASVATVMEHRNAKRNPWQDEYYQGARKARDHRTLTHAGITQAAQFHLLSGRGAPLADLYVGHAWAVKVGQLFADIYGEPVQLVQHDSSFASVYDEPTERVPAAHRNPSRDPVKGETWTAWQTGNKCVVREVWGSQVEYLDKSTGNRTTETVSEFKATHKPPRTLTNPARAKRAKAKRKPNSKRRSNPNAYAAEWGRSLGSVKVGRTVYTIHQAPKPSNSVPWVLLGPRKGVWVLARYPAKPWLFHAVSLTAPGGNPGVLKGVTFTGEAPDQLTVFKHVGPRMNGRKPNGKRRNPGFILGSAKAQRVASAAMAKDLAQARGENYGVSAFGGGWYVGKAADLETLGVPHGGTAPNGKRRKAKRVGTTAGRARNAKGHFTRGNPRPFLGERARAERMFEKWHEFPANRIKRVKVPSRVIPKHVVGLGKVVRIDYISNKWEGKPVTYTHDTERPYPELVTDPDGKQLYLVGGKMRPTADGLVH